MLPPRGLWASPGAFGGSRWLVVLVALFVVWVPLAACLVRLGGRPSFFRALPVRAWPRRGPFLGLPFLLFPRPSGLGFISPFFWAWVAMYRPFRRTVSLDVSGLAGSNDRQAVSKFIVDHFSTHNIHAVQFIGTIAKITFAVEASKQQVMSHQSVSINGVQCAVRGGGPLAQNVLVYNYPVEGDEEPIRRKLRAYGVVEHVKFRHWTHLENACDGVRVVRMVRNVT